MTMFTKPEPLNDAELDRRGDFFKSCKGRAGDRDAERIRPGGVC